ncbi:MAG TPA: recombinase family protein [Candidatus Eisenbacteria bacterium]|nr:recombinase family protein [Candidatus Eisenbacteria bacterium]
MDQSLIVENAVAAIRVSSTKQGTDGDSPEAQKEQIERFALTHHINIKKFFVFMESASKEQQPMQEAIDYCKNPKNNIQLFIIKSIDRFTRGGSYSYDHLKMQLERYSVKLVDIYGIISSQKVNTLEHLGVAFDWSVYSPTKKAEILEAERAKDEMRDIMSRMIGAEIRYSRMGYSVREAPFGYVNEKIETSNGKRCILKPHPIESQWIIKMFELRARGTLDDHKIVEEINKLGFKTRIDYVRDPKDRTKIIREHGGNPLNIKGLWKYIQTPSYAGVIYDNWTKDKPVKAKFNGLISVELFNKANKGKMTISEENGEIKIYKRKPPEYLVKKGVRNPDFPYKRYVMCPHCERPLFGSASRGRLGKYYPAYHCNKRGHYFRVPKDDFEKTIRMFVKTIKLAPGYPDALAQAVIAEWEKREKELHKDDVNIDMRIAELKTQAKMTVDKIKFLTSEVAIKYMEEDLVKIEEQVAELLTEKEKTEGNKPTEIREIMAYIKYFLEHMEFLLLDQSNPISKAGHFDVLFDEAPTYQEILSGTHDLAYFVKLNEVFIQDKVRLAAGLGFEPK